MTGSPPGAEGWPPTPTAALARLEAIRPAEYARSRNHIEGAVTGLSPYVTHGFLTLPEVLSHLKHRHKLNPQHKLAFELGWREFFRHAWHHDGDAIFASLHPGPLADSAYARHLPPDIREARTGLPVIDESVKALYATGYLHNHARMWVASYIVHLRKVHWLAGANWMYSHLLDGDLASNHLSWQWVAGTASHKPYLFNAENVRRYAPPAWHVDGSAVDTSYEALDRLARNARDVIEPASDLPPAPAPALSPRPPADAGFTQPNPSAIKGRDVWVVHPWCLRDPPPGLVPVAILDERFHAQWPWNEQRWRFVTQRMSHITKLRWVGDADALAKSLSSAQSLRGVSDPHLAALSPALGLDPPQVIWPEPGRRLRSFSAWWNRVQAARDRATAPS